jgi:hypothetical protein
MRGNLPLLREGSLFLVYWLSKAALFLWGEAGMIKKKYYTDNRMMLAIDCEEMTRFTFYR